MTLNLAPGKTDLSPSQRLRVMLAMPGDTLWMDKGFARQLLCETQAVHDMKANAMAEGARAAMQPHADRALALLRKVRRDAYAAMVIWLLTCANVLFSCWLAGWFG